MKQSLLAVLVLSVLSGLASAAGPAHSVSGIDTRYIESAVRPQDDYFAHMSGKWLKETVIPADKPVWGSRIQLHEETQAALRSLIEEAAAAPDRMKEEASRKVGDFYTAFLDEARAEELGLAPLRPELARIAALQDKSGLPAALAHASRMGVSIPVNIYVHQDNGDSSRYILDLGQSGLGLPDRDYYLKDGDPRLAGVKAKYRAHIERMLALAGGADPKAEADAVLRLETALARVQWSRVETRDPVKAYNKMDVPKLHELAPGFDWNTYLKEISGTLPDHVNVRQPSYLKAFAGVAADTPLDAWKAYLRWMTVRTYAPYLSRAFVEEHFAFHGQTLSGLAENSPRWKRGVAAVDGALGELLGQLYVRKHFTPEAKARMDAMVENLFAAYRESIDKLDWMSPKTRQAAQDKLAKFRTKVGYPSRWKDYAALEVSPHDLVGNIMRAHRFAHALEVGKLGKPVDRGEWHMTPQTINAYYNAELNEIVFPAAVLQPPFFQLNADEAANYGAIGTLIGHEISHGFDDRGSQFDGDGNLRNWWSEQDRKNFNTRTAALVAQYDAYSPLPGYHVDGKLTLSENIADNAGMAIAFKAYKRSLGGKPAPLIDGMTGEQRFYAGLAQAARFKMREQAQIVQLKTDPHSPVQYRVNGTLKNQPGFYEAYGVKEGDKLYLAPQERVIIW